MHGLCHPFHHEGGSPASVSGVTVRPLSGEYGLVTADILKASLRPDNRHMSRQKMFWMENTHNAGGGAVLPFDVMRQTAGIARDAGLKVHIDGARIFNASVASGIPVSEYAGLADTMSFCLSKGLGAPVGSLLCGSAELVHKARRFRHMLGGGWRQAGILAAAGIYALRNNVSRLSIDHANARRLAEAIDGGGHLKVTAPVHTNMVMFAPRDPSAQRRISSRSLRDSASRLAGALADPVGRSHILTSAPKKWLGRPRYFQVSGCDRDIRFGMSGGAP